jgi:hypothetical protein
MEKIIVGRFRKRPKVDLWSYCSDVFHQMSSAGIDFRKVSNPSSEYETVVILDDPEERDGIPWLFRLAELMGTDMIVSSSTRQFNPDGL